MGVQLPLPNIETPRDRVMNAARKRSDRVADHTMGTCPPYFARSFWSGLRERFAGLLFESFKLGFSVALREDEVDRIRYEEDRKDG